MNTAVVPAGVIEDAALLSKDLQNLLINAGPPLMGLVFVLTAWWRTKAFGPTVVAVLAACVLWWAVENMELLKNKAGEDLKQSHPAVLEQGHRPPERSVL